MYLSDVIEQLRKFYPRYSSRICDTLTIKTISFSSITGLVTVETNIAHGLVNNEIITILDCKEKIPISSISVSSGIASVITSLDHDLTLDYINQDDQPLVGITECTVSSFNGSTFKLHNVLNRRKFSLVYSGAGTVATDGFLLQDSYDRYNGLKTVNVISSKIFTFTSASALPPLATAGYVKKSIRISGSIDIERVIESYTKQGAGKFYLFVIPAGTVASKSRDVPTDETSTSSTGLEYRQLLIPKFQIYMFVPCSSQISGRAAYDLVISESVNLFKSILGFSVRSPYSQTTHKIVYESDAPFSYNDALYIHVFNFSSLFILNSDDIIKIEGDRAYRDCSIDIFREDNIDALETAIDLDEEEL